MRYCSSHSFDNKQRKQRVKTLERCIRIPNHMHVPVSVLFCFVCDRRKMMNKEITEQRIIREHFRLAPNLNTAIKCTAIELEGIHNNRHEYWSAFKLRVAHRGSEHVASVSPCRIRSRCINRVPHPF